MASSLPLNPTPSPISCRRKTPLKPHPKQLPSVAFTRRSPPPSFSTAPPRILPAARSSPDNPAFTDEWGEKSGPEPEPPLKKPEVDPPIGEDEWGGGGGGGNGAPGSSDAAAGVLEDSEVGELKRALIDTVFGSDLGFRASAEVRAETLELVSQLEAANPNPKPTESLDLLDGNWVLVYTAFSELVPLLAAGNLPLVKVDKITQSIDTSTLTIDNSITLSNPVSTFSFSASAAFEVRSPTRIQVEFKEGTLKPPGVKSSIDLPENINLFGQNISLSPVQQSLGPLENALSGLGRALSGQRPLTLPIPGERAKSWLLITYLDEDLRISRGDGGLFVLVKEGSPLVAYI